MRRGEMFAPKRNERASANFVGHKNSQDLFCLGYSLFGTFKVHYLISIGFTSTILLKSKKNFFTFFADKLGSFVVKELFSYVTNTQA
jgi:hypothetical protein